MIKQLIKIGNSCGVTLPAEAVGHLGLKPGDKVEVYADARGLHLVPVEHVQAVSLQGVWEEDVALTAADLRGARKVAWKRFAPRFAGKSRRAP